jgi:hypothetical protein
MLQVAKQEHPSGVLSCRLCLISLATSSPPMGTSCSTSPMRAPGSSSMLTTLTTLPGHSQTGTQKKQGAGIIIKGWPVAIHRKKSLLIFPSPAGMSLTRLSLGGNYDVIYKLFLPRESSVSDIPAGDGNVKKLFLRCTRRPAYLTCAATKIPFTYSQKRNCMASVKISTFMYCERFIYSQDRSTYFHEAEYRQTGRGNIKIAHRHMNVEIGNICFEFSRGWGSWS